MASADGSSEQLAAAIREGVIRSLVEEAAAAPSALTVTLAGDLVVCVLEQALLPLERTLRDSGQRELAWLHRTAISDVLRSRCSKVVEAATGRSVLATASGVEIDRELVVETFVLGAAAAAI